ncbi:MAG: hypothetical protein B1H08_06590 [Candidatus Omnitrophica bacterium 4484_171]|nr:MAG: hypothetical protein B1H08_06590 [Candidatus Omnitrophica bacterium 4484_171]
MKVLITGGATWVRIDKVRILTNVFTGKTSVYLASYFARHGCKVTLLINTHCVERLPKDIKVIPFRYFDDLKRMLIKELKHNKYNAIIHTAAVSDYLFPHPLRNKIPSGKSKLTMELVTAPKLTNIIYHYAKGTYLVQFKLEALKSKLINKAKTSLLNNKFDAVVANSLSDLENKYQAILIDKRGTKKKIHSKKELAKILLSMAKLTQS